MRNLCVKLGPILSEQAEQVKPGGSTSLAGCGTIDLADRGGKPLLTFEAAQKEFEPACVYAIESWRTGRAEAAGYDALIDRARRRFASLVEVPPDRVAIGNQVSTFTGLVAAALPDGTCVLAAEEDFTSVLFPFLARANRGVRVETVPLDRALGA
jgi:selenocysteine lyase/cysteine desulfurase